MKKVLKISGLVALILILVAVGVVIVTNLGSDPPLSNDNAVKDKEGRYITIVNNTNQIINEVHTFVGEGTEIEAMEQKNPDRTSFSIEIPDEYSDYDTFTVVIVDRYGIKYVKEIDDVPDCGRTEVIFSESDCDEDEITLQNRIDKFFNGD